MKKAYVNSIAGASLALLLGACATTQTPRQENAVDTDSAASEPLTLADKIREKARARALQRAYIQEPLPAPVRRPSKPVIISGDGSLINEEAASKPIRTNRIEGEIKLNFELADIRDVVKVVFDALQENYILDPGVQGEVSVQTSRPLPKSMLIPVLETLLRQVGATIVRSDGAYKVVPIAGAVSGNLSPRLRNVPLGYSVRIFPLRYISATEMETILQPFAPEGGILLVDPVRNFLILAGTSQELRHLQETIDIFDVNWLEGMSVAMYVLENVEAADVAGELENLFGANSGLPFAGMFRFVPISRLNAILVITPQADFLDEAGAWIERLDGSGGERLYVYQVQNSDADYLASLLNQVFEGGVSSASVGSTSGQVAPSRQPAQISSPARNNRQPQPASQQGSNTDANANQDSDTSNMLIEANERIMQARFDEDQTPLAGVGGNVSGGSAMSGGLGGITDEVRIIADTENNALLVWATSQDYDKILNALRSLDVPKRQVLIEATIAEVTLTDNLSYGIKWFFEHDLNGSYTGTGFLSDLGLNQTITPGAQAPLSSFNPVGSGFTYAIADGAGIIRALLDALAEDSKVRILSSPQIMVIDNQQAKIQVGDEQPVRTSTTQSDGGNVTESIQFKDTGVLLEVQPQINAGGMVNMDINQEVTDVGQIDEATGQRSFLRRSVNSKVAVQSGQTIVLGGLIRENSTDSQGGIPVLHKLPVVGPLFGSTTNNFRRTELVILITPRVIKDSIEAQQVTSELKERMKGVIPLESPWKTKPTNKLN